MGCRRMSQLWTRDWAVQCSTVAWDTAGILFTQCRSALCKNRKGCGIRLVRSASPCLWNQLPVSIRQPLTSLFVSRLSFSCVINALHRSSSIDSPLSLFTTPLLFHSPLKTYPFHKSFQSQTLFLPQDWLHSVMTRHRFFWDLFFCF